MNAPDFLAPQREHASQHRILLTTEPLRIGDLLCAIHTAAGQAGVRPIRYRKRFAGELHDDVHGAFRFEQRTVDSLERRRNALHLMRVGGGIGEIDERQCQQCAEHHRT